MKSLFDIVKTGAGSCLHPLDRHSGNETTIRARFEMMRAQGQTGYYLEETPGHMLETFSYSMGVPPGYIVDKI